MAEADWTKKSKGAGAKLYIYKHCSYAIVERKYGLGPLITWKGVGFSSVSEAKKQVEEEYGP